LSAIGGLTGTTGYFSNQLSAFGGLTGTTGYFSDRLSVMGGLTGTTGYFSDQLSAIGGLTGTTAYFSKQLFTESLKVKSINQLPSNPFIVLDSSKFGSDANASKVSNWNGFRQLDSNKQPTFYSSGTGPLNNIPYVNFINKNNSTDSQFLSLPFASNYSTKFDFPNGFSIVLITRINSISTDDFISLFEILFDSLNGIRLFKVNNTSGSITSYGLQLQLYNKNNSLSLVTSVFDLNKFLNKWLKISIIYSQETSQNPSNVNLIINNLTDNIINTFSKNGGTNYISLSTKAISIGKSYATSYNTNVIDYDISGFYIYQRVLSQTELNMFDSLYQLRVSSINIDGNIVSNGPSNNIGNIWLTKNYQNMSDSNSSEITNDTTLNKKLMIYGNTSSNVSGVREVGISDNLTISGSLTGTTGYFSNQLSAFGGLTGTTGYFSNQLSAFGGLTGTTGFFSNQLSAIGGLTGTTGYFSNQLSAMGGITGTSGYFSSLTTDLSQIKNINQLPSNPFIALDSSRFASDANGSKVSNWNGFQQSATGNQPTFYSSGTGPFNNVPYVDFNNISSGTIRTSGNSSTQSLSLPMNLYSSPFNFMNGFTIVLITRINNLTSANLGFERLFEMIPNSVIYQNYNTSYSNLPNSIVLFKSSTTPITVAGVTSTSFSNSSNALTLAINSSNSNTSTLIDCDIDANKNNWLKIAITYQQGSTSSLSSQINIYVDNLTNGKNLYRSASIRGPTNLTSMPIQTINLGKSAISTVISATDYDIAGFYIYQRVLSNTELNMFNSLYPSLRTSSINIDGNIVSSGPSNNIGNIWLTKNYQNMADSNSSEITNDTIVNKKLMIYGNTSNGGVREVGISDNLTVSGRFLTSGGATISGGVNISGALNANNGATIKGGALNANNGATISGGDLCLGSTCLNENLLKKIISASTIDASTYNSRGATANPTALENKLPQDYINRGMGIYNEFGYNFKYYTGVNTVTFPDFYLLRTFVNWTDDTAGNASVIQNLYFKNTMIKRASISLTSWTIFS
jgi:hypothetical protein